MAAMLSLGWSSGCSTANPPDATTQQADAGGATTDAPHMIPAGTSLVFSVDERVSTATHARGDVFSATLRHHVTLGTAADALPDRSAAATMADADTLVTLTTRGGSAILPAGSAITVQLTEPLEV